MIVADEVSEEDAFSHFQRTLLLLFWSYCHGNKGIEAAITAIQMIDLEK